MTRLLALALTGSTVVLAGCGSAGARDTAAPRTPTSAAAAPTSAAPGGRSTVATGTQPVAAMSSRPGATKPTTVASAPVWSSRPVSVIRHPAVQPVLTGVRVGHHTSFDRVVFDFSGALPGYRVRYVPRAVGDGSGRTVQVAGQAVLEVRFEPAAGHTSAGRPSAPARVPAGFPSLREAVRVGDFEGVVSYPSAWTTSSASGSAPPPAPRGLSSTSPASPWP